MGRSEREEEKEEMKRTLIALLALCLCLPLAAAEKKPLIADAIVGGAIRFSLKEPKGELTKADLEKVTELFLFNNPPRRGPQGSGQAPAAHISSGGRHRNNADGCG